MMRKALILIILGAAAALPGVHGEERTTYHSEAWCAWGKETLLVVIVPPAHGSVYQERSGGGVAVTAQPGPAWNREYLTATVDAAQAWERALHRFAAEDPAYGHLRGINIDARISGESATPEDLQRADITVVFTSAQDAGGRTVMTCKPSSTGMTPSQIVMNSWFVYSYTMNDMYNIMLHEMGHGLGLEHVTEAPGDILQPVYPYYVGAQSNPRMCVSSLNMLQLAESFAWLGGAPFRPKPAGVAQDASEYRFLC